MSAPRQILPGKTYFITRRISQRQFWLTPSVIINQIVLYCLAVAAQRYGVAVHAVCVMSNHWHAVVTDVEGNLPRFLHWFHKHVSSCINDKENREENLWSSDEPCYETLEDEAAIMSRIVYCLANPVEAELVPTAREWPGFRTLPQDIRGKTFTARRPAYFFSGTGRAPETASLTITRPPMYPELSDEQLAKAISSNLLAKQRDIHRDMKKAGRTFLGKEAVLMQSPTSSPSTPSKRGSRRPRFAASNPVSEQAARDRKRNFERAYAQARLQLLAGKRDAVFPAGTWALARYAGVAVEPYASP